MPNPIIRNRITGYREIPRTDLVPHPRHCWAHSDAERKLLRDQAGRIGITSVLLVRPHPTAGKDKWEIIDGKMRSEELVVDALPCITCDLNDAEAESETKDHNLLTQLSSPEDPELRDYVDRLKLVVPDPDALLHPPTDDAEADAGATVNSAKPPVNAGPSTIKPDQPPSIVTVLLIIPMARWGEAAMLVAQLEKLADVTVQKSGAPEPTPA